MHRSAARRDDAHSIGRRALPPGKSTHGIVDGDDMPSTETPRRTHKSSKKARPLSSSTNKSVPGPEVATRLPSAPSQWKIGRSPTPGPPDENDDWILNQEAPPMPPLKERSRSRTRTTSAGGSRSKTRSDDKKPRSFTSQDDTALPGGQSGRNKRVAPRTRRNTDAQTRTHPGFALKEVPLSLRRRSSWGRNNKDSEEYTCKAAGRPEVASSEPEKNLVEGNPYFCSGQTSLLSPTTYIGINTQHSASPLPREPTTVKARKRTQSSRAQTYYGGSDVADHELLDPRRPRLADDCSESSSRMVKRHEATEPKVHGRATLGTPQLGTRSQSLSPNMDADDSASEPASRTPRLRSSSRSSTSPLLIPCTSSARSPSNIPTPNIRTRASSTTTRADKSPLPHSLPYKSPGSLTSSLSPVPPSDLRGTSPGPHTSRGDGSATRIPSRVPAGRGDGDENRTPRVSRIVRNQHQSSTEGDTTCDEKSLLVDHRSGPPRFRSAKESLSPNPTDEMNHCDRRFSVCHHEIPATSQSSSDFSDSEETHANKSSDDSHVRRKNELVDLVAGLNLNLGPPSDVHAPMTGYQNLRRDPLQDQSDEVARQVETSVGRSNETGGFREYHNRLNKGSHFEQRKEDTQSQDQLVYPPSRRYSSQRRHSPTPRSESNGAAPVTKAGGTTRLLKPDSRDVNRDSLLMLNSGRQREAFGIPPSMSDIYEGSEMLSSAESNTSLRNQALNSERECEATDGLGLSYGAEQLFHALGIGADAPQGIGHASEKRRVSWRSSMAEAEKYLSEGIHPVPADISASSSNSSIYEEGIPERPWQRRERDLDRVQSATGSSIKSSWRKTLSQTAYIALLERHGEIEMRRQEVIWELCETEQAFLKSLRTALTLFVNPLLGKNRVWVSGLPSNITRFLDWLEDIFQLHAHISSSLQRARSSQYPVILRIAETLRAFVPRLEVYQPYIVRLDEMVQEIEEIIKDPTSELGEFFRMQSSREECSGMSFGAFLWLPLTRLGRYLKHFNELWTLTPRSHVDHLPTFSLLHSATMVVRVMHEVKLREEEYVFVKELLSRVRGFPALAHLVRRERRLVAHGTLQRVHVSERTRDLLEGNTLVNANSGAGRERTHQTMQRRRANSLDSCLSDATSMSSLSSAVSGASLGQEAAPQDSFRSGGRGAIHERGFGSRVRNNAPFRDKTRVTPLYAFVFTDLAIFATMVPCHFSEGNDQKALELLDDIGICRVLSMTDYSGNLGYDHLIGVQLLPMDAEQLDGGIPSDASTMSLFLHLAKTRGSASQYSEARKRWWSAFEQCYRSTLRSISFPVHPGKYLGRGLDANQDENTRQTVMAILASGLPLPKSPSAQISELEKSAAKDASLREREERGWWAVRFQQILHEIQQDSLPLPSMKMSLPTPSNGRKTLSGRRHLKLATRRKQ